MTARRWSLRAWKGPDERRRSSDIAEQVSRVLRPNEETQKFVAEQKKLMAEAAKLDRDRTVSGWQVAVSCLAAGAALFGAGAAFNKLIGS